LNINYMETKGYDVLERHVRLLSELGQTEARLVLVHGERFPPPERKQGDLPGLPRAGRQSFRNAFKLAEAHSLVYCEGYALNLVPTVHAWCWNPKTGQVIDPTWGTAGEAYFGVRLSLEFARETVTARGGVWGVLPEQGADLASIPSDLWLWHP
jgi:hypothetical protein